MADVIIDGKSYKEVKVKKVIVNGKEQDSLVITADQLEGQEAIEVSIEAEPDTQQ